LRRWSWYDLRSFLKWSFRGLFVPQHTQYLINSEQWVPHHLSTSEPICTSLHSEYLNNSVHQYSQLVSLFTHKPKIKKVTFIFQEIFHIGQISYNRGDAFACNPLFESYPTLSLSGASNAKYTVEYLGLLNMDGA
jgi:hypothetical protein